MATQDTKTNENQYKIKLQSYTRDMVTFDVTPDLIETRNVNYSNLEPIHMPGQITAFKNTSSRSFNISNIRLVSRTQVEADKNLRRLWLLRSWCTPRFGRSTLSDKNHALRSVRAQNPGFDPSVYNQSEYGIELVGAPPTILYLSAYSRNSGLGQMQHINKVPTVIQQLSIPYPSDVDYIPTSSGTPMPTVMTIDITLMETHSPLEYENFSLDSFKRGNLGHF